MKQVWEANLELIRRGVVIYTWGNVSGVDRESGLMVIKPSGVNYDEMKPEDMVAVDLASGAIVEGRYKPSSDTVHILNCIENSRLSAELHILIPSMRLLSHRQVWMFHYWVLHMLIISMVLSPVRES